MSNDDDAGRAEMETHILGKRNVTIQFGELGGLTTVHLIIGEKRVYLCDTYLGPVSMSLIVNYLKKNDHSEKDIVVFNSHADWDHIWGNCYFKDSPIVAHKTGRTRVVEDGERDLEKWKQYAEEGVIITPPNLLFDTRLVFADDEVEFFYTPGHTIDSSSCYDHKDKVLFVGDNVESDIPYVNHLHFDTYIASLESYLKKDWIALVAGHDPIQEDDSLIRSNIEYLKKFRDWTLDLGTLSEHALQVHLYSLIQLVDELLEKGVDEKVRAYFANAFEYAINLEKNERNQRYVDGISRLLNST